MSEPKPAPKPAPRQPMVVCLADVKPEAVSWLWYPYIPLGKLTLLEGDPGVGKSWLALTLASLISCGKPFPQDKKGEAPTREPANVLYLSAEDGLGDTIRPRLDATEANVSRVHALLGWEQGEGEERSDGCISLGDLAPLAETIERLRPVLVVIDPLQAYLGEKVDMHRANEVRPILAGLAALAEQYACAILILRHLTKSLQNRAVYQGIGSIDFAAAARSILLAGLDPKDPKLVVVAHSKSSLAVTGRSFTYELREGGFWWRAFSDLTADDLLRVSDEEPSAIEEAADFLKTYLSTGEKPAKEVIAAAKKAGISETSLKRSRKEIAQAVRSNKTTGKQGEGLWVWKLIETANGQEGHDEHLDQNPLRANHDLLEMLKISPQNQLLTTTFQEGHMTFLNERVNGEGNQEVISRIQEGHREPLGETGQEGHLHSLNESHGGDDRCACGNVLHPTHKACFRCKRPRTVT